MSAKKKGASTRAVTRAAPHTPRLPENYLTLLAELKGRVRSAQAKAATSVNRELIAPYLHIGRRLAEQEAGEWGDRVVEKLAKDLRSAFPSMSGFRVRRPAGPHRGRGRGLLRRPSPVPPQAALLRRHRPEGRGVPPGVRGQDELLSLRGGRADAPSGRPTSIGLLLCKAKNELVVEYALRDVRKPIGVAKWETRIVESLPKELKGSLPTVEELEAELAPKRRKR